MQFTYVLTDLEKTILEDAGKAHNMDAEEAFKFLVSEALGDLYMTMRDTGQISPKLAAFA